MHLQKYCRVTSNDVIFYFGKPLLFNFFLSTNILSFNHHVCQKSQKMTDLDLVVLAPMTLSNPLLTMSHCCNVANFFFSFCSRGQTYIWCLHGDNKFRRRTLGPNFFALDVLWRLRATRRSAKTVSCLSDHVRLSLFLMSDPPLEINGWRC